MQRQGRNRGISSTPLVVVMVCVFMLSSDASSVAMLRGNEREQGAARGTVLQANIDKEVL